MQTLLDVGVASYPAYTLVHVFVIRGCHLQGMGVHGISRLRLTDSPGTLPERDPTATEDYYYWLGDGLFDGWGTGPNTASLAFR